MSDETFNRTEEVILDPLFPDVDMDLRRGRHINKHESERYRFLKDAEEFLEEFYGRYGWELRHAADGYFHLLPSDGRVGRHRLDKAEMLVGQILALMYLDPESLQTGGVITNEQIVARLAGLVGEERLVQELNLGRKRHDERVAQENVRKKADTALRELTSLGFVETVDEGHIRLCPALLRFAEPVRGPGNQSQALEDLITEGAVATDDEEADPTMEGEE